MAVRLRAGAALPDALAAAEEVLGSPHSRRQARSVRKRVEEGESLSSALFYIPFFPRTLAWAVSMGEARGEVPEVFDTFARLYSAELDRNFGLLLQILTPLGLLALGNVALLTALVVLAPFFMIVRLMQVI
jgi:type II secretory pathway component PulF